LASILGIVLSIVVSNAVKTKQIRNAESNQNHRAADNSYSFRNPITLATIGICIATFVSVAISYCQWQALKDNVEITRRALVGVERPVLLISMPQNLAIISDQVLDPTKVKYGIVAENVGKQIATI
jgi:hypothetical protein